MISLFLMRIEAIKAPLYKMLVSPVVGNKIEGRSTMVATNQIVQISR